MSTPPNNKFRFSIDRGGTFTDVYAEVRFLTILFLSVRCVVSVLLKATQSYTAGVLPELNGK
jgi:hypothetical protein